MKPRAVFRWCTEREFIITLATFSLACAGATSSGSGPRVTIRVVPDTVALARTEQGAGFLATAIIRNDDVEPVFWTNACTESAQRSIDGVWSTVWTPICASNFEGRLTAIAVGDSMVVSVNASAFSDPRFAPTLDSRFQPGIYRLAFQGFSRNAGGIVDNAPPRYERYSAPFVVR